ncbi:MAG TPA: 50S ribosomal protein L13 [Candidatus Moranbacteria bacterium]|nr:50S ribosomal protein L13 [Candidatus Moranbacteria bacterium]
MKKEDSKYVLIDAKEQILGRLAVQIARILSGKDRIDYSPNVGGVDHVVVINSDLVRLSGEKEGKKLYYRHSSYPGSIKETIFSEMMEKDSRKVIELAVKGMVPKNKLARKSMARLHVFKDSEQSLVKENTNAGK